MAEPTLKVSSRCDRCGSQAYVLVEKMVETPLAIIAGDLLFCRHHYNKFADSLLMAHWTVIEDLRDTLNPKPSLSASAV